MVFIYLFKSFAIRDFALIINFLTPFKIFIKVLFGFLGFEHFNKEFLVQTEFNLHFKLNFRAELVFEHFNNLKMVFRGQFHNWVHFKFKSSFIEVSLNVLSFVALAEILEISFPLRLGLKVFKCLENDFIGDLIVNSTL